MKSSFGSPQNLMGFLSGFNLVLVGVCKLHSIHPNSFLPDVWRCVEKTGQYQQQEYQWLGHCEHRPSSQYPGDNQKKTHDAHHSPLHNSTQRGKINVLATKDKLLTSLFSHFQSVAPLFWPCGLNSI